MRTYKVRSTGHKVGTNFQYVILSKTFLGLWKYTYEYVWAPTIEEAVIKAKILIKENTPLEPREKEFTL